MAPHLLKSLIETRTTTERLCAPLEPEDFGVQTMADVSPPKWHLAHTTWFFEEFVLKKIESNFRPYHHKYAFLFNSYYESVGPRLPRSERGMQARPTAREVLEYRHATDERLAAVCSNHDLTSDMRFAVELGIQHEQQHQELLMTDIKHIFATSALRPEYLNPQRRRSRHAHAKAEQQIDRGATPWVHVDAGMHSIGASGEAFSFDNERPEHRVFVEAFDVASRLVTCGEFKAFIDDGGYERPEWWLSDGWAMRAREHWNAPLYWEQSAPREWVQMTLAGMQPVNDADPVCHVSYYEADAYARWAGARLPTEAEWEICARRVSPSGNFLESGELHPVPARPAVDGESAELNPFGLVQLFGDAWEWTQSAYLPYPGFTPFPGGFAEYNGKFMANQMVLRGGSCVTPQAHIRATYRNFFAPHARWQFSSFRLCRQRAPRRGS